MGKMKDVLFDIEDMKQWCLENYENGGDVAVECWGDNEWYLLATQCEYDTEKMWRVVKDLAEIYEDQRANARIEASM